MINDIPSEDQITNSSFSKKNSSVLAVAIVIPIIVVGILGILVALFFIRRCPKIFLFFVETFRKKQSQKIRESSMEISMETSKESSKYTGTIQGVTIGKLIGTGSFGISLSEISLKFLSRRSILWYMEPNTCCSKKNQV